MQHEMIEGEQGRNELQRQVHSILSVLTICLTLLIAYHMPFDVLQVSFVLQVPQTHFQLWPCRSKQHQTESTQQYCGHSRQKPELQRWRQSSCSQRVRLFMLLQRRLLGCVSGCRRPSLHGLGSGSSSVMSLSIARYDINISLWRVTPLYAACDMELFFNIFSLCQVGTYGSSWDKRR